MELIRQFADVWMPVLGIHTMEVSAFILLVLAADRLLRLDTRLRYGLYLMALIKVFVPPLFLLPSAPIRVMAPTQVSVPPATGEALPTFAAPTPASSAFPWPSWTVVALTLWAASILVMAAITVCQNLRLRRTLRNATLIPGSKFKVQSSRSESTTVNLEPSHLELFRIFSTPTIHAPVLVGLFRPRLYLPEDWTSWPEAQVRGILAHEMAHLRARDPYVLIPQALALVLFGFNPLVWLLCARLTYLRELRCDEAAIETAGIDPVDYSRLLYGFVQKQNRPSRLAVTGTYFSENQNAVLKRFRHILNFKEGIMSRQWWHYAAPVLLGLMILPLSVQGRAKPEYVVEKTAPETRQIPQGVNVKAESGDSIQVDRPPIPHAPVMPKLPRSVRGVDAEVTLNLLVGKDGRVKQVDAVSGEEPFRQAVIEAAKTLVFTPAAYKGEPIAAWTRYKFNSRSASGSFSAQTDPQHATREIAPPAMVASESGDRDKASVAIPPPSPSSTQLDLEARRTSLLAAQLDLKAARTSLLASQSDLKAEGTRLLAAQSDLKAMRTSMLLTFKAESGDSIVVEKAPKSVRFDYPKHPEAAKKAGLEGTVKVQYLIGTDGRASRIEVLEGGEPFKQAVVEGLRAAVWEPAIHQGRPVAMWKIWTYPFRLLRSRSESGDTIVVDQQPGLNHFSRPAYPQAALRDSLEGVVQVNVLVGEDGKVKRAEVTRGDERFRQAATDAAMASAWRPAMRDGKPVSVWNALAIPFGINRGDRPPHGAFIPVDTQPQPIAMPRPVYPESALRDSLEGLVWFQILLGRDGSVQEFSVQGMEAPDGVEEAFKQSAADAIRKSEWFPATYRDRPVSVWVTYPIRFTLHGGPPPPGARMPEEKGQQPPKSGR